MFLILNLITIALYVGATAAISTRLFHVEGPMLRTARISIAVALVLHAASLYFSIVSENGQNLSILNVASMVAWLITVCITAISIQNRQSFLLPLVAGFTALIMSANLLVPNTAIMHVDLQPYLLIHICLALFAYGSLSIALLYAIQLSFINNKLKHDATALLHSSLPPLMRVEQSMFKLLLLGTVLLTFSLLSGFVFLEDMFAQRQVHKTILSSIAWFLFVGIIIAHSKFGTRGGKITIATVIGIVLLTLAYFGSRIVKELIL